VASLQSSTVNGIINATTGVYAAGGNTSPWYRMYHCADATSTSICNPTYSCGWLHIRTPLPATQAAGGIGWNPNIVEVVGFHTYSGEVTHDFRAIVNNSGDANDSWFGSQIRSNQSNHSSAVVYQSSSAYGGFRRVCIALPKIGCCCVGWVWVRWWNNSGYRANFAWAVGANSSSAALF
jgi:hypothetical protein